MKNPLEILGCNTNTSKQDIIINYKKLAMKYHPDRNSSLDNTDKKKYEEQFKEINCAFTYLKKNNFKYSPSPLNDFASYSNLFNSENIDISSIFNNFRNIKLDTIADNIIKGINTFQNIYNNSDDSLKKTDNICVNANIELFDIYFNIEKTIVLKIQKKCKTCMGIGYQIETKDNCKECDGTKYKQYDTPITFYSMFKTIKRVGASNEEIGKRTGNIYISIFCKAHPLFRIIDNYNILYKFTLSEDTVHKSTCYTIIHTLTFLDKNKYTIEITQPVYNSSHIYTFNIKEYGLFIPNSHRGDLIIEIYDPTNIVNKLQHHYKDNINNSIRFTKIQ